MKDELVFSLIKKETVRQNNTLNLIASENYPSQAVLQALASLFTAKYAEGYAEARYYSGNRYVDEIEKLTEKRALKLFKLNSKQWSVNVQPYSGSPANLAVYLALVPLGGKIMGLKLPMGGHLTHGHFASASGKLWKQIPYAVEPKTEKLNYEEIGKIARKKKPRLIVAGFTAYPRKIDFKKFRDIAHSCRAILMVDLAHLAGLVAAGVHSSPFSYADVVTTTTHKTLRGARGAMIFSRKKFSKEINKAVFPGLQGGPHVNQIAAAAVALKEAASPSFRKYIKQVLKNTKVLADALSDLGWRIVSGGTDTHLLLVDTGARGVSGKKASDLLEKVGIIVNKNTIPYDERPAVDPSGIRLGTPALTTRGLKEKEMVRIAELINVTLLQKMPISRIKKEVLKICRKFPLEY